MERRAACKDCDLVKGKQWKVYVVVISFLRYVSLYYHNGKNDMIAARFNIQAV